MARNNSKILSVGIILGVIGLAFTIPQVRNIFTTTAGSKAIDSTEGKDIAKLTKENQCPKHYPWGAPKIKDKEVNKRSLYICRTAFAVQYDPIAKVPLWSSEVLEKRNFEYRRVNRAENFQTDIDVPSKMQATLEDFKSSGYDRGHMAPAADMVINLESLSPENLEKLNIQAMQESFYLTNIAPQVGSNMNRGIWADLEAQTRYWALQKNQIFVTTGPIFLGGNVKEFIGKSKVAVPTHFFKVITDPLFYGSVSYIIPNKEIITEKTTHIQNPKDAYYCNGGPCSLENFVVPIQEVERVTGIEFYPRLAPYYAVKVKQDINEYFRKKIEKQQRQ